MMKHTGSIYSGILTGRIPAETRFEKNIPSYPVLDKIADSWFSRIFFGAAYTAFYIVFADYWWMYLLLPIHFLMGPVHGAIVNWAGHKYGYRNFKEGDHSKNTLVFDFLMLGELFQNNHHHAGARPNFAAKWYEIDPVYPVIRILDKCKIIRLVKIAAIYPMTSSKSKITTKKVS